MDDEERPAAGDERASVVDAAAAALQEASKYTLGELRSIASRPPASVSATLELCCVLLGLDTLEWKTLLESHAQLVQRLVTVDRGSLTALQRRHLRKYATRAECAPHKVEGGGGHLRVVPRSGARCCGAHNAGHSCVH